jgi:lipoyl(octanoyl) transferase
MPRGATLIHLGVTDYREGWELQRALAAAVTRGSIPDTVVFLEHPPTVTLGRRTEPGELHIPDPDAVAVVETDRGGKSTYHAPGQLVCYPILDLNRHGRDVRRYCRSLEQTIIATLDQFGLEARRIEGLTGVWVTSARGGAAKIASIGVHISRWVTTHGYALNVDLDPAPFTEWITACGLENAAFTSMAHELGRPVATDEVRAAAATAFAREFELDFIETLTGEPALWPVELLSALDPELVSSG